MIDFNELNSESSSIIEMGPVALPESCPSVQELRRFLNPDHSGTDDRALMNHYINCQACLDKLDEVARQMALPINEEPPGQHPAKHLGSLSVPGMILDQLKTANVDSNHWAIGDYEVVRKLKSGGMGDVYECVDARLNRRVAVKTIHDDHFTAETLERFQREAEILASLKHPNIVSILELGQWRGWPFFAMEFVAGPTLAEKIRGSTLLPDIAASLIAKIARAVAYAHENGVIHRDLKPANILIEDSPAISGEPSSQYSPKDWQPKIIDFGLSKWLLADSKLSHASSFLGTPGYMAPEQTFPNNDQVGFATDIYAIGIILYETIAGQLPFKGESIELTVQQIRELEPVSPRTLNPSIPRDLEIICLKCLQKEPAKRYASAMALAVDVERYLKGEAILARPAGRLEKTWRWCRRNRLLAGALGTSAALLVGLIGGSVWFGITQAKLNRQAQDAEQKAITQRDKLAALYAKESQVLFGISRSLFAPEVSALNSPQVNEVIMNILNYYREMNDRFANDQALATAYPEIRLDLLYHLGGIYNHLGDQPKMAETFEELLRESSKVTKLTPLVILRQLTAANGCAIFFANSKEPDKAQAMWLSAWNRWKTLDPNLLRSDPRLAENFKMIAGNLAALYQETGRPEEARQLKQQLDDLNQTTAHP